MSDGKLLRKSDMVKGGSDQVFYSFDEKSGRPAEVQGSMGSAEATLRFGNTRPALEGKFKIKNSEGKEVEVATAFEMLKKRLKDSRQKRRRNTQAYIRA